MEVQLEQSYQFLKGQKERLKDYCFSSPLEHISPKDVFLSSERKQNIHNILFNYHIVISGYV